MTPEPGTDDVPGTTDLRTGEPLVSATLYYSLVTLLLVVLIGGMAVGLALGCRLPDVERE